jgi:hypothetical protein
METASRTKEDVLFNNVGSTASANLTGMTHGNNNHLSSKLNGNINISGNKRVGPSIILKVMAGDTISVSTYGWYTGAV